MSSAASTSVSAMLHVAVYELYAHVTRSKSNDVPVQPPCPLILDAKELFDQPANAVSVRRRINPHSHLLCDLGYQVRRKLWSCFDSVAQEQGYPRRWRERVHPTFVSHPQALRCTHSDREFYRLGAGPRLCFEKYVDVRAEPLLLLGSSPNFLVT
jgi:hypothetical protein